MISEMSSKSTVHHRKGATGKARDNDAADQPVKKSESSAGIDDAKKLTSALQQAKREALSSGLSPEEFRKCVITTSKRLKLHPLGQGGASGGQTKYRCLKLTLKVLWVMFLMLLAVALMSAAVKPVMFYIHKLLHTHMYSITRPVRIALVSVLPYFQNIGIDFFNRDCLLENPFLSEEDLCPCMHVKYPVIYSINSSLPQLPVDLLQSPLSEVIVVENGISIPSDISIDKVIEFGQSGLKPKACTEMTVQGQSGLLYYEDLFMRKEMKKYLKSKEPWTFSWEECPDERLPLTLRSLFPSPSFLPPHLTTSTNSLFSITSQWAPSSYYHDIFPDGRLILTTVLLGEMRLSPEPNLDSNCVDHCSGFKHHPVLKQGDSVIFDQQYWSYQAVTWSEVALTYSVALT